jgi:hypothetical protein
MVIDRQEPSSGRRRLYPLVCCILVMGISLALVVVLWLWIGHIGPSYSSNLLIKQQEKLRAQFGLPHKAVVSDPKILLTPPSLRPPEYRNCIPYSFC